MIWELADRRQKRPEVIVKRRGQFAALVFGLALGVVGLGAVPPVGASGMLVKVTPSKGLKKGETVKVAGLNVSPEGAFTATIKLVTGIVGDGKCGVKGHRTCVIGVGDLTHREPWSRSRSGGRVKKHATRTLVLHPPTLVPQRCPVRSR
jgi:hypothetical protein